jgi:hypothetical protein
MAGGSRDPGAALAHEPGCSKKTIRFWEISPSPFANSKPENGNLESKNVEKRAGCRKQGRWLEEIGRCVNRCDRIGQKQPRSRSNKLDMVIERTTNDHRTIIEPRTNRERTENEPRTNRERTENEPRTNPAKSDGSHARTQRTQRIISTFQVSRFSF